MSGFVPTAFNNLGKQVKDLFSKRFDYNTEFSLVSTSDSGLKVQTTGQYGDDVQGRVKASYNVDSFGKVEGEGRTSGRFYVQANATKLGDGIEVEGKVLSGDPKTNGGAFTGYVQGTYKQEYVAVSTKVEVIEAADTGKWGALITPSLTLGMEGLTVGGKVAFSPATSSLTSKNLGLQYNKGDFVFTALTSGSDLSDAECRYFHNVNRDFQYGVKFNFNSGDESKVVSFASAVQLDRNTHVKANADTRGALNVSVQHQLGRENVRVNVASSFSHVSGTYRFAQEKVGLGVTYGDN